MYDLHLENMDQLEEILERLKREGWVYNVDFVATRAAQSHPLG